MLSEAQATGNRQRLATRRSVIAATIGCDRSQPSPRLADARRTSALLAPDASPGRREIRRLPHLPRRHRADARLGRGEARLHRLPRRQRHRASPKKQAHVQPRNPELWKTSANPPRTYTALLDESPEFVRFINPGDLRVAHETCGGCHQQQTAAVPRSTMTTSAVFWAAVSYANGSSARSARSSARPTTATASRRSLLPARPPTPEQIARGALPQLVPLPRWEIIQPGEYFRAFERGGIANSTIPPEIGNPNPRRGSRHARHPPRQSRTRHRLAHLAGPHQSPQDAAQRSAPLVPRHERSSRRLPLQRLHGLPRRLRERSRSAALRAVGAATATPASRRPAIRSIPKNEKGHPIRHQLTRAVPTSQCMSCHMHQPNSFVNTYLGYTMWDYETDAELLWPKEQRYPTEAEKRASLDAQSRRARRRAGSGPTSISSRTSRASTRRRSTRSSPTTTATAGSSWPSSSAIARATSSTRTTSVVSFDDPEKFEKAVHLKDIHLERGMHCADCHFSQDEHGNGQLYGEYGNTIEIECQDCHGTAERVHEPPHVGTGRAAGRHRPAPRHDAVRPAPLRLGRTASSSSARWSIPGWSGKSCR